MKTHPDKPRGWRGPCATCGQPVKGRETRYCCPACVPRALRAANCRKSRKTYAYRRRALMFRADLERIGKHVTRAELLAVLWAIYKRGYNAGFRVGRLGNHPDALRDAQERGAA